jgi:hypothetical protein
MGSFVGGGGRLALTAALSHFPELELELEFLGSGYNAYMMRDEMEVFWIRSHRASESRSSRVPPSIARNHLDNAGEE